MLVDLHGLTLLLLVPPLLGIILGSLCGIFLS